jgi:hypothetical protein
MKIASLVSSQLLTWQDIRISAAFPRVEGNRIEIATYKLWVKHILAFDYPVIVLGKLIWFQCRLSRRGWQHFEPKREAHNRQQGKKNIIKIKNT